ncbi:hypothetical protein Xen7305DRAFT_00039170 [Xenococcus sp. PCC 7305]|nr:hypothetical protein Xen7305DRAFT_00039170 [Xenococcus sp. PCC 7305]
MKKQCETSSDQLETGLMPYPTLGAILLITLAVVEYLALFLTMRPIRLMIF